MPPEIDYDELQGTVAIDLGAVEAAATTLETESGNVGDGLRNISNAIGGLRLGWAGTTAEQVEAFSNRWIAVATALFGTEAAHGDDELNASDGVLNVMVSGLRAITRGWSGTEDELKKIFDDALAGLSASGDGNPTSTSDDAVTAVNQVFSS
ncbi:hypothetical protein [Micromonospora sp. NBC_01813]|uniref:hypothetical protein n=1 Tax=Micromonospora sp. NBC_01813 TaxID=2975988 RepID=UPI002DD7E5B3|nr:hypothetical protein [Micromonospora sp. NBC_01813]WSA12049.1 hypothetical protein OG958_15415 [Micromonospora sp. NBC_01813]